MGKMAKLLSAFCLSGIVAGYSPSAAISWSGQHCADGDGTECAEFASNALRAGGHTMCYNTWVPTLDSCLKNTAGWKQTSFPCSAGCAVVWQDSQGPYHMAMSRGSGVIDQHNPNRCGTSGSWGTNYCLCPPYFAEQQPVLSVSASAVSMSQIANYWISAHSKDHCQRVVANQQLLASRMLGFSCLQLLVQCWLRCLCVAEQWLECMGHIQKWFAQTIFE